MGQPAVSIVNETKDRVPRKFLIKLVASIYKELGKNKNITIAPNKLSESELTIVFLNKNKAKKLNQDYRERNYATDILSFIGDLDRRHFGDLVICMDVIKKQATEHGLTVQQELGYMLIHGILHLLGYDHEQSPGQAKKMFQIQDSLFKRLLEK